MKKKITSLLALLLSLNTQTTQAITPGNEAATKAITAKSCNPIKSGDALVLSEFKKMASGIMYKIVKKGATGKKAIKGEMVLVNYSGYLLDGKKVGLKFDSSFDRNAPFSFKLGENNVIRGWEISLADMEIGETRIVILPSNLAYGSRAAGKIPADSSLIFEITLIKAS